MTHCPDLTPIRIGVLALAASLAGCSALSGIFADDKIDYRTAAKQTRPLEVPPDLSQLARDSRYLPQSGVISAAAAGDRPAAIASLGAAATLPAVAVASQGEVRLLRDGQTRWLLASQTPEQLWPQVRAFWEQRGFVLNLADAQVGVMETRWSENRAKLPSDVVRNTLGRLVGNLYDTGERDLFRTRLERTPAGTEIFISHRGAAEVYENERRETTTWRARPSDPQLEAEFLSRLMLALGAKADAAASTVASSTPSAGTAGTAGTAGAAGSAAPARARLLSGQAAATLEVDDPFDRAWRRVGLALDRSGFTVEDRDRAGGLYYVRYVDPKSMGKEEPGFFSRLFGNPANPLAAVRYRVAVKGSGEKSTVSIQTSAGAAETGENGKQIASTLLNELR